MRILIVNTGVIPVTLYGGTDRVIWGLGKELTLMGHSVTYLVGKGSKCNFASVLHIDESKTIIEQIPKNFDIVHFNFRPKDIEELSIPYIITAHNNSGGLKELDKNTVFVSKNHALRYQSNSFVHNGLDWSEYSIPELKNKRDYFHFLGKAAWRVKNVTGAISVIKNTKSEKLKVLGGVRFNINMGIRFTFSPRISFAGMVGGQKKYDLINGSKGLIFPVKWHEPFGLAIIESLYYGCPVFGTPHGSLPELIGPDVGYLSTNTKELSEAILSTSKYDRQRCHDYARETFSSKKMAIEYIKKYEKVLSGSALNATPPKQLKKQEQKWLEWN